MRPVFGVYAIANVLLQVSPILASRSAIVPMALALGAAAVLIFLWTYGVRRGGFGWLSGFVEVVALVLLGLNLGQPAPLLNVVFGAIYIRGLYGTNRTAAIRTLGYMAVLELLAVVHHPTDPLQTPQILWTWVLPSFALATLVVRTISISVARLTRSRDLSAHLSKTASDLLTATSPTCVKTMVEACARAVVPDASFVRLEIAGDPPTRPARSLAVFTLVEDGRVHGRLLLAPSTTLTAQQRQTLGTVAAQATAAIEAAQLRAMLIHRTNHDALTGLPNRALFREVLTRTLGHRGRTIAVLFVDLDDFKVVNDSLGHPAGDALLIEVATRILDCLRPGDVAARMGGDEFAVLLDGVETGTTSMIAKRILAVLEEPFLVEQRLFNLHCSVGIAHAVSTPDRAADLAADLVRDADMAMYVAKTHGKNRFEYFSATMAETVMHDRRARDQLSSALVKGELELHFQPIVSLIDGAVTSVESLVRWRHPTRGLLLPGDFLPQAEQVGLMPDLERWAIVEACHAAAAWPGTSPPAVAVNISPQHLARSWLVPAIRQALAASGLPGERLVLEITEESAVLEPAAAAANLRECVALGARVAIDDFGAGHASLRHIGALPISTVKIDRSLVSHETGPVVIRSVAGLAHALGLQVIAEGVETAAQLAWLRESDCDAVQGFLLARPTPAAGLSLSPRPVGAIASGTVSSGEFPQHRHEI